MKNNTSTPAAGQPTPNGGEGQHLPNETYLQYVKRQFRKNRLARVALYFTYFMFIVAIFADFLANDRPIACGYKGEFYMPVVQEYLKDLGMYKYPKELNNVDWKSLEYDWSLFPPVRYHGNGIDGANPFVAPLTSGSNHYLGTDQLGRDLLAGLIHGARISLSDGFISMSIAAFIGISLGAIAGFFGGWVDILITIKLLGQKMVALISM